MNSAKYEPEHLSHQSQTKAPICVVAFSDFEGNFNALLLTISEAKYGSKPLFQIVYEQREFSTPSFFTLNPELVGLVNLQVILGGDNINRGDKNLELVRFLNNTIRHYKEAHIPFAGLHVIAGNRDVTALRLAREYPYRQEMLYTGVSWGPKKTIEEGPLQKVFAYTLKDFLIKKIEELPTTNPLKSVYNDVNTVGREAIDAFLIHEVLNETGEYAHPEWFIHWQYACTMGAPKAYELYKNELEKIMAMAENSLTELATVKLLQMLSLKPESAAMQALLNEITQSALISTEQIEKFTPYVGLFYSYLNEASLISILDLPENGQKAFISHSGPSASEILPLLESGCSWQDIQTQWNTTFHDALDGTYVMMDGVPSGEAYDKVQRVPHSPGYYFVSYAPNPHLLVDDITTRTERGRSAEGQFSVMNDYDLHKAYLCCPESNTILDKIKKLRAYGISLAFCGHFPTGPSQGLLIDEVSAVFTDFGRALNTGFSPEANNTDTTGEAWSLISYHSDGQGNSFFLNQGTLPKQHVSHSLDGKHYRFCVPRTHAMLSFAAFPTEFSEYAVAPHVGHIYKDIHDVETRVIGLFDPTDGTGMTYYSRSYSFASVTFQLESLPLANQYKWYPTVDHYNTSRQAMTMLSSASSLGQRVAQYGFLDQAHSVELAQLDLGDISSSTCVGQHGAPDH